MRARLLLAVAALIAAACATPARDIPSASTLAHLPALAGDYFPLASQATGRTYHIYVRLPDGYDPAAPSPYPIVYVLDGDSLWPILAANHLFLTYDDALPEAIVVGIAYGSFAPEINGRDIDFMPPGAGMTAEDAGAPEFARFLETELLPRVEGAYRADPARRVLFGQSRGGSFVLYSAFAQPDVFVGRIASNPAFGPTMDFFMGDPADGARDDLKLLIASGEHDRPVLRADALAWEQAWESRDAPWDWRVRTVPGGTHAANATDAYRAGMRWFFRIGPAAANGAF